MARYRFVTRWRLDAPIDRVWDALVASDEWPQWWPSVIDVRDVAPGDATGLGKVSEFTFKGRLPYLLSFTMTTTRVDRPSAIDGEATGELAGSGRWRLREGGSGTEVTYVWEVRTTRRWMKLLAPLLRPAFAWNHDAVMRSGERGLRDLLARDATSPTEPRPATP